MIELLPWTERKFTFDFPVGLFPVIYSRLEGSIFRLEKILENNDNNLSEKKDGGWSVKEHIGHLTDLEALWWQRLKDFKSGKEVLTAADMSNQKTNEAGHNEKTTTELIDAFRSERQNILDHIYRYDEEFLAKTSFHPRLQQPMRVIDSLFFVAEHDDHHIAKISELLNG
jgi:uncharacterized damage-inducible protein DinB